MRPPKLTLTDNALALQCSFQDKEIAKSIPGRRWNPKKKCWEYPLRPEVVAQIRAAFPMVAVDEQVLAAVEEVRRRERAVERIKQEGWQNARPIEPMPVKTKPYQHQIAAYNIALQLPATALLMEQGTGKSWVAVAVMGRRFLRGEVRRALIVAPSSVLPVWPKEFEAHADFPYEIKVLEGLVAKRIEVLETWKPDDDALQVAVINYEATWRMEDALTRWAPDMITCDESQRIKTPSAKQSKAMHRLGQKAKYRLILTGTPVTQAPLDFFSQYKFLDPHIFGQSYYAFRSRYAIMGGYGGYQVVGYRNLPELAEKAHSIAFRVTKAETLDLPEQVDQVLYCELEREAEALYRQMVQDSIAELSQEEVVTAPNVLTRLLRLSQICGGFITSEDRRPRQVSTAKLGLLCEALDDLGGKKVVIFARFLPEIAAIQAMLAEKGLEYAWITGERRQEERGEEVLRFQEDPNCRVFLAQIQTAGLGITLHAADTAIFYSLDFSYANYDQCRARIHRIGQRNTCTYIHLLAKDTVDEKIMQVLRRKKNVADVIVDRWRDFLLNKEE